MLETGMFLLGFTIGRYTIRHPLLPCGDASALWGDTSIH